MLTNSSGVKRTDFGYLGAGLYFGDTCAASAKYAIKKPSPSPSSSSTTTKSTKPKSTTTKTKSTSPSTTTTTTTTPKSSSSSSTTTATASSSSTAVAQKTWLMLVFRVYVGRPHDYTHVCPTLTSPPNGCDSCHGVAATATSPSDFVDNEWVVYDLAQQQLEYFVAFACGALIVPTRMCGDDQHVAHNSNCAVSLLRFSPSLVAEFGRFVGRVPDFQGRVWDAPDVHVSVGVSLTLGVVWSGCFAAAAGGMDSVEGCTGPGTLLTLKTHALGSAAQIVDEAGAAVGGGVFYSSGECDWLAGCCSSHWIVLVGEDSMRVWTVDEAGLPRPGSCVGFRVGGMCLRTVAFHGDRHDEFLLFGNKGESGIVVHVDLSGTHSTRSLVVLRSIAVPADPDDALHSDPLCTIHPTGTDTATTSVHNTVTGETHTFSSTRVFSFDYKHVVLDRGDQQLIYSPKDLTTPLRRLSFPNTQVMRFPRQLGFIMYRHHRDASEGNESDLRVYQFSLVDSTTGIIVAIISVPKKM
ncbi:hypothetical protein Pelo_5441 [Pelomyxa schiedti]|nr:hypothetical protein Pelo_5441 [Pelomyxa schiedti]